MVEYTRSSNQPIIIALIGLFGVIATAVISNWDKLTSHAPAPTHEDSVITKSSKYSDSVIKVQPVQPDQPGYVVYSNFAQAFEGVLDEASSNFAALKGPLFTPTFQNYRAKVVVSDKSAIPSNIFPRGNEWAFRFQIFGRKEDEPSAFTTVENTILGAFDKKGLKVVKSTISFGKGDVPMDSYEYKRSPYRVDFTRMITGAQYSYEIIVYHSRE